MNVMMSVEMGGKTSHLTSEEMNLRFDLVLDAFRGDTPVSARLQPMECAVRLEEPGNGFRRPHRTPKCEDEVEPYG